MSGISIKHVKKAGIDHIGCTNDYKHPCTSKTFYDDGAL